MSLDRTVFAFAGVMVLWSAVRGPGALPTTRYLLGSMLLGWGAFNLVEGIIDHHLLDLHHVRDLPIYDYREALRPSTRLGPPEEEEYGEEG